MMPKTFVVYEHQVLELGQLSREGQPLEQEDLDLLSAYHGRTERFHYYSLVHKGVKFSSYVGVLEIGSISLEILPKMDKQSSEGQWRRLLISMLQAVYKVKVDAPSSSDLSIRPNSILDLYFALFLQEVEQILRRGLVKKYQAREENQTALKGRLLFSKQISKNLVHQERFYVRHQRYTTEHPLHSILYQTLELIQRYNRNTALSTRIITAMQCFPENLPKQAVHGQFFDRLHFDRKTRYYQPAMHIAELLLLNFHPDIKRGDKHVLALMFDMNRLWEEFVLMSLKRYAPEGYEIIGQESRLFWKKQDRKRTLKPDIVLRDEKGDCLAVLDTKWKRVQEDSFAGMNDLRQMYAYLHLFDTTCSALLYPSVRSVVEMDRGEFYDPKGEQSHRFCAEVYLPLMQGEEDLGIWMKEICFGVLGVVSEEE